jgi:hypothetical protein
MFDSGNAFAFFALAWICGLSSLSRIEARQWIAILRQSIENVAYIKDLILSHES